MQQDNSESKLPLEEKNSSYWNKWYIIVIGFLLVQVALYYFITAYFK